MIVRACVCASNEDDEEKLRHDHAIKYLIRASMMDTYVMADKWEIFAKQINSEQKWGG